MWEIKRKVSKGEYDYAVVPEHPHSTENDYVLYHRVVMENKIGRLLDPGEEIVHHIDGDKKNNDIDNLELYTRKKHAELHGEDRTRKYALIKCPECLDVYEKKHNKTHLAKNTKTAFCSRSCNGKFVHRDEEEKENRKENNIIEIYRK